MALSCIISKIKRDIAQKSRFFHTPPAFDGHTGCLQLLEILEISWNLKTLLEILEISWNLNGPPGNFCVMIANFILWLMALLHDDVALFVH